MAVWFCEERGTAALRAAVRRTPRSQQRSHHLFLYRRKNVFLVLQDSILILQNFFLVFQDFLLILDDGLLISSIDSAMNALRDSRIATV